MRQPAQESPGIEEDCVFLSLASIAAAGPWAFCAPSQGMHQQDVFYSVLYDELGYGHIVWLLLGLSGVN